MTPAGIFADAVEPGADQAPRVLQALYADRNPSVSLTKYKSLARVHGTTLARSRDRLARRVVARSRMRNQQLGLIPGCVVLFQ